MSTDPPGAECGLYREEGQRIATIQRTPGSAPVRKTKHDIWIVCVKPGYQQAVYYNRSGGDWSNVVAGVLTLGISTAVDSSTGSDNKYESRANIVMVPNVIGAEGPAALPAQFAAATPPGAYSQQVAAGRGGTFVAMQPPRAQQPMAAQPAPPADAAPARPVIAPAAAAPAASTAYDGSYSGSVEVLDANTVASNRRQFDVRVANGVGTGTVRHGLCDQPGEVSLTIDPSGAVRGRANTRNTVGCTERVGTFDGRVDGGQIHVVLRLPGNPTLVMSKTQGGVAAAPAPSATPAARGRFDGVYSGPMELATGDLRQIWLRVVGTKGTGSVRRLSCGQPGLITISIASDGSISGDADVLNSVCATMKAAVRGQLNGTRMAVAVVLPDGQTSQEFVFTRRSYE